MDVDGAHQEHENRRDRLMQEAARAQAGDADALIGLLETARPVVLRMASRRMSSSSEAEDVCQEVLIELWKGIGAIHSVDRIYGWLAQVVSRACQRARLRSSRCTPSPTSQQAVASECTEDAAIRLAELSHLQSSVRTAVDRLRPEEQRLLELLAATERPDYRAISTTLERPIGSIGPTRQRVLTRLSRDRVLTALR